MKTVRVLNKSKRKYVHQVKKDGKVVTYNILPNETKVIPEEVAKFWLVGDEIQLLEDTEVEKELAKLKAENEALKKANEPVDAEREALISRAKELKIKGVYNKNIPNATIEAKIKEAEALEQPEE